MAEKVFINSSVRIVGTTVLAFAPMRERLGTLVYSPREIERGWFFEPELGFLFGSEPLLQIRDFLVVLNDKVY